MSSGPASVTAAPSVEELSELWKFFMNPEWGRIQDDRIYAFLALTPTYDALVLGKPEKPGLMSEVEFREKQGRWTDILRSLGVSATPLFKFGTTAGNTASLHMDDVVRGDCLIAVEERLGADKVRELRAAAAPGRMLSDPAAAVPHPATRIDHS